MKNIRLDCFNKNDFCRTTSMEKSFSICNPLEKEFLLEIFNHGTSECAIAIKPINSLVHEDLGMANLTITANEKVLFQNDLATFFAQEVSLGSIASNSSTGYFFSIDLLNLVLEEKKLSFNFDLLFDFNCEEVIENSNQIKKQSENLEYEIKRTDVLSASSSATEETVLSSSFFKSPFFSLLLSSLFVLIFFVIMKFINGQKKKKQAQVMV